MDYQDNQIASFIKGINASVSKTSQPQGSVPRASNLILTRRGSLVTCDGSKILFAFNGAPANGRGKILVITLFQPTGSANYYMALIQSLDLPLGPPKNLSLSTGSGGTLPAATYFYEVTALDGVGGETTASNEASIATGASGQNTLTWNYVPNASGYNVYRSTSTGTEKLLIGSNVPVPQVGTNNLTVSFIDTGADSTGIIYNVTSIQALAYSGPNSATLVSCLITLPSASGIVPGQVFTYTAGSDPNMNRAYTVVGVVGNLVNATTGPFVFPPPITLGETSTGGTMTTATSPPSSDTTQQIALVRLPYIVGTPASLPVSYNNSNVVALFPALLTTFTTAGGGAGGSGGGGGTSGGGSTGGGGTGGRGPRNIF